jgi:hypothetical protein
MWETSISSVGGCGLVLGVEGVEDGVELGCIFSFKNEGLGVQAVFDAVETDGGATFRSAGAGTFLRVEAVCVDLLLRCHSRCSIAG